MPDYKSLYMHMAHASEEAIRILIAAQRECEEEVLSAQDEPELIVLLKLKKTLLVYLFVSY